MLNQIFFRILTQIFLSILTQIFSTQVEAGSPWPGSDQQVSPAPSPSPSTLPRRSSRIINHPRYRGCQTQLCVLRVELWRLGINSINQLIHCQDWDCWDHLFQKILSNLSCSVVKKVAFSLKSASASTFADIWTCSMLWRLLFRDLDVVKYISYTIMWDNLQ